MEWIASYFNPPLVCPQTIAPERHELGGEHETQIAAHYEPRDNKEARQALVDVA
jgi:hypothetical protein